MALIGMEKEVVPQAEGSWPQRLLLSHPTALERVQTLGRMLKKP